MSLRLSLPVTEQTNHVFFIPSSRTTEEPDPGQWAASLPARQSTLWAWTRDWREHPHPPVSSGPGRACQLGGAGGARYVVLLGDGRPRHVFKGGGTAGGCPLLVWAVVPEPPRIVPAVSRFSGSFFGYPGLRCSMEDPPLMSVREAVAAHVHPSWRCLLMMFSKRWCPLTILLRWRCPLTILPRWLCPLTMFLKRRCPLTILPRRRCPLTILPRRRCPLTSLPKRRCPLTILPRRQCLLTMFSKWRCPLTMFPRWRCLLRIPLRWLRRLLNSARPSLVICQGPGASRSSLDLSLLPSRYLIIDLICPSFFPDCLSLFRLPVFSVLGSFISRMCLFMPVISVCPVPSLCPVFSVYVTLAFSPLGWFQLCFWFILWFINNRNTICLQLSLRLSLPVTPAHFDVFY